MFKKDKKEENEMKEVEQKVDEIKQKPKLAFDTKEAQPQPEAVQQPAPQQPQQPELKTYVVSMIDTEDQLNIGVIAPDIMTALQKFAVQFQEEFKLPVQALNIVVEEINFIK